MGLLPLRADEAIHYLKYCCDSGQLPFRLSSCDSSSCCLTALCSHRTLTLQSKDLKRGGTVKTQLYLEVKSKLNGKVTRLLEDKVTNFWREN